MHQVRQHPGQEVGLTRHQQFQALIRLNLIHQVADLLHPGQIDLLHPVVIIGNDVSRLGNATLLAVILIRTAITVFIEHGNQHWRHNRVGFYAFLEKIELLLGQFRVISANPLGWNQALEDQAIFIRRHVLYFLGGKVNEIFFPGVIQFHQSAMQLLDLVNEPGLIDIPLLHPKRENHQVTHAEIMFSIQVGSHVTVCRWQQGIRIVTNVQIRDLYRTYQCCHDQKYDNRPAELQYKVRVLIGKPSFLLQLVHGYSYE